MKFAILILAVFAGQLSQAKSFSCISAPITDVKMGAYTLNLFVWIDETDNRLIEISGLYFGYPEGRPRGSVLDNYQTTKILPVATTPFLAYQLHQAPSPSSSTAADIRLEWISPTQSHLGVQFNNPAAQDLDLNLTCSKISG